MAIRERSWLTPKALSDAFSYMSKEHYADDQWLLCFTLSTLLVNEVEAGRLVSEVLLRGDDAATSAFALLQAGITLGIVLAEGGTKK